MKYFPPSVLVLAAGCGGVTWQMQTGLEAATDALAATALASGSASYVRADATDGEACPAIVREGDELAFTVAVDYGDGCDPTSGLVAARMSGSFTVDYDDRSIEFALDDLSAAGTTIDGTLDGSAFGTALDALMVVLDTVLTFGTGGAPADLVQSVVTDFSARGGTLSSDTHFVSGEREFDATAADVALDFADVWGACPLPHGGDITVTLEAGVVEVAFLEDTPSTGDVEVTFDDRTRTMDLCAYASALY